MLRKYFLLLLVFAIFNGLYGQLTQVRGTVQNEKGIPINRVKIQTKKGTTYYTDSKGQFVFNYNIPMRGEVPEFKFTKNGYTSYIWEYDRVNPKTITLHLKKSVVKAISGVAKGKNGKVAPHVSIQISDPETGKMKEITRSDENGRFSFNLTIPKPTTSKPYNPNDLDKAKYGAEGASFVYREYYNPVVFFWDGDYSDFEVVLATAASGNNKKQNSESSKNATAPNDKKNIASKDADAIHLEIDEKHAEIDTTTSLSNEKINELKNYIAYLESILEQNEVAFDKSALGQDSTIHQELKSKLTELKTKVAEKEKEVKKVKKTNWYLWLAILIIVLILIPTTLAVIFYRNNKKTQKLNIQLDKQNKELSTAYANITSSIQYAQRIQRSILVKPETIREHFEDSFVLYKPKDIVSGDFYWFSSLTDQLIITAVDCTGHGVPGAFMTMMGNSFLNEIVNVQKVTEPSKILTILHQKIQESLRKGDSGSNDGMDIALVSINKTTKKVKFAGANNPLLFISNKELQVVKAERGGIGGTKIVDNLEFKDHEIDISQVDAFYLFSDGFQDQFGGKENRKFMKKRFKNLLLEHSDKSFEKQEKILDTALEKWKGDTEQTDDILVIGIKV